MEIIAQHSTIFYVLAFGFGLYMCWGIGANDVANAMGTSVGSGALTVKQALIIAAIMEFAGAYLAGGAVAATISKGHHRRQALRAGAASADVRHDGGAAGRRASG
jgi:PiT family inorganic phosphate transporter